MSLSRTNELGILARPTHSLLEIHTHIRYQSRNTTFSLHRQMTVISLLKGPFAITSPYLLYLSKEFRVWRP